ncbi:MAG: trypsin-like serine peptidase [Saprospiraceae bacterium]
MASVIFSQPQLAAIQSVLDAGDSIQFQSFCKEYGTHAAYSTDMGRLIMAAELEANIPVEKADPGNSLFRVCGQKDDMRCQVGHVLSNLRSRTTQSGVDSIIGKAYTAFRRNVESTVLIVDKSWLEIGEPNKNGKIRLKSIECRQALDLSKFARDEVHRDLLLCDSYFYANELIPDTDIYGSGFFIDHDKVVTAAHVLVEAFKNGVSLENLLFIRGRYVYDTDTSTIDVMENQLYLLDEPAIFISEQMRKGDQRGDMAWVKAKPFFEGKTYPFEQNGFAPELEKPGMAIYALGHGLGVPMKLSFGGRIQDITYKSTSAMFTCDMNILPGCSGSPIFDADTHRLLGIVSGLHEIYTNVKVKGGCVELIINMNGDFSGVATHIAPFSSL